MKEMTEPFDVLIVGCGGAGLSAAVSAAEAGARVCVLERASFDERGGNTRHTGAWMRMKSETEVSDDFEEHFANNAGGYLDPGLVADAGRPPSEWSRTLRALSMVDPNVVSTLAEQAPPTLAWLKGHGVRFIPLDIPFPTSIQPRIQPSGGGRALVEALAASFERLGGTIIYETAAQSLRVEGGRVVGVEAIGPGHRPVSIRANAVILASGGFQGNAEMMNRYLGPRALHLKMMSNGCHFNKGEGIRMALDIGAAPCGDFGSWHASPMDPRSARAGASMYVYPYGILVNQQGSRFVDEGPGHTDETYEGVTREIFAQARGMAWVILDARLADVPNLSVAIRTDQPPIEADSIETLADRIGIPAELLATTIDQYNRACPPESGFNPRTLDGLATRGIWPRKSHWARPIDRPPFKAYPIVSSIVFTFGGLKTTPKAEVLNQQGDPIPGLYAVGETQGLYYGHYTGATSVLKGTVFGRIAGQEAARIAATR
jgi:tricarballylate dehydrogenase